MINHLVRKFLTSVGLTVLRGNTGERIRILGEATLKFHLRDPFEFILFSLLEAGEIKTILQIGANDGLSYDNITRLVQSPDTRCILVEPNPEAYQRLSDTHRDTPGVLLENVAISVQGESTLRMWSPLNSLQPWGAPSDLFTSSDREHLVRLMRKIGSPEETRFIDVPAVSSLSLLEKHGFSNLDLLAVDTEGADASIIKAYPFASHCPKFILFEHIHLKNSDFHSLLNDLATKGFRFTFTEQDTFAVQTRNSPLT